MSLNIIYNKKEVVNSKEVIIDGENDEKFWDYHGYTIKDKPKLQQIVRTYYNDVLNKLNKNQRLTEFEQFVYQEFTREPIKISLDEETGKLKVNDGRHRMRILKEDDVNLEFDVQYVLKFRERSFMEFFNEEDRRVNAAFNNPEQDDSIFIKIFKNIFNKNSKMDIEKFEEVCGNKIDAMAVFYNAINIEILERLGIEYNIDIDKHYVIFEPKEEDLNGLITRLSSFSGPQLVSTQNIREGEER